MKVNVSNMPNNILYQFSDDCLVYTKEVDYKYPLQKSNKITEVIRLEGDEEYEDVFRIASGELVDDPNGNDYDNRFVIKDFGKGLNLTFYVTSPFKEATLEDLFKLRRAIQKQNKQK